MTLEEQIELFERNAEFERKNGNLQGCASFLQLADWLRNYKCLSEQKSKMEHCKCKNCKYFEYDSVAKVDGIPLIVAHEICKRWGDGCQSKEDGYCFLFESQESEVVSDENGND